MESLAFDLENAIIELNNAIITINTNIDKDTNINNENNNVVDLNVSNLEKTKSK